MIGATLLRPRLLDEPQVSRLTPEHFYAEKHKAMWAEVLRRGPEAMTVLEDHSGVALCMRLAGVEPTDWVDLVSDAPADLDLARTAADVVHACFRAREFQQAGMRIWKHASEFGVGEDLGKLDAHADATVAALAEGADDAGTRDAGQLAEAFLAGLQAPNLSISTGFPGLDSVLGGGLFPGELVVVGARPSCGKTSLARGIARNIARRGTPVWFASLEVPDESVFRDLVVDYAEVPAQVLRSKQLSPDQAARVLEATDRLNHELGHTLLMDDDVHDLQSILATARSQVRRKGVKVMFLDYLQLVDVPGSKSEREAVGLTSKLVKRLARTAGIAVVALAQLNREADKRSQGRPSLSDLKESGSIEQDADVVVLIHRPDKVAERNDKAAGADPGRTELIVAKNRDGPTGSLDYHFEGRYMRFRELPRESNWKPRSKR